MANLLANEVNATPVERDRPNRTRRVSRDGLVDSIGSVVAALASVWLVFSVAGVSVAEFGFFFCWAVTELYHLRPPRVAAQRSPHHEGPSRHRLHLDRCRHCPGRVGSL